MTPTELALIAATLSKNDGRKPQDNLQTASELWSAAAVFLVNQQANAKPPELEKLPFDDFLDKLKEQMPSYSKAQLTKKYNDFIAATLPDETKATRGDSVVKLVLFLFGERKKLGVTFDEIEKFQQWHKSKVASSKAGNAKKMHAKRATNQKADRIERAANSRAIEKKSRIEFHDPAILAMIADKEQRADGGTLQD